MSRLIGFAITGLAVYLAINSLPNLNTRAEHDTAVAIATDNREGMARDIAQVVNSGRSFSPGNPLTAHSSSSHIKSTSNHIKTVVANRQPAPRTAALTTTDAKIVRAAERVRATGESQQLATTQAAPTLPPVLIKAVIVTPPKPENIVRETQRELKRVGCYRGRIDGKWGRGSRKALRKFVKRSHIRTRANGSYRRIAAKPEAGVLGALRKTSRKICGRPCASGKMLSSTGRCIIDPVIMASLAPKNSLDTAIQPAGNSEIVLAANAKKAAARARILKKKRAKRKWRQKRYALGGPGYYKKHRAARRSASYYRAKRRKRAWIREVFAE